MEKLLSSTFRSLKPHSPIPNPKPIPKPPNLTPTPLIRSSQLPSSSSSSSPTPFDGGKSKSSSSKCRWSVYLILSTNIPIKTYVGVTTNFSRRLKQHNGELKGGAKASRSGRPWVCACTIRGFKDKSEACKFETQWKTFSKKLPRKKKNDEAGDNDSPQLLQHRHAALTKVKDSTDCSHLKVVWKLNPF